MRKIFVTFLLFAIFLTFSFREIGPGSPVLGGQEIQLWVGKREALVEGKVQVLDESPKLFEGRVFLSIGSVSDLFDLEINFVNSEQKIEIRKGNLSASLWIGKQVAYLNGEEIPLDVSPRVENGITFIPLKFLADILGYQVLWNSDEQKVSIFKGKERLTWDISLSEKKEAIEKGKSFASSKEFVDWERGSYEVAMGPNDRVVILTPYASLVSLSYFLSSREEKVKVEDLNPIFKSGKVYFLARVFGNQQDFFKQYSAKVRLQDGKEILPVYSRCSEKSIKIPLSFLGPKFFAFCLWAFPSSELPASGTIHFVISDPHKGEESALIDLGKFK